MLTELFASMDPWDGQGRLDGSGGPGGPTGDTDEPDLSQSVLTAARKRRCPCCHGTGEHASGFECCRCDSSGDLDGDDPGEDSCDGAGGSSMSSTAGVTFGQPHIGESSYEDDDGFYKGLWDRWHPLLQKTMHRAVGVQLDHDHPAHDESLPLHERAHALLDHVARGASTTGNLGHHWTDDPQYARKHLTGNRFTPGETPVVVHADTPPRHHIEDNEYELKERRAVHDWDTEEREVPLKRNAPVRVTGISWPSRGKQLHYEFPDPIHRRASAEGGSVRQVPPEEYRKYQLHDYPTARTLPALVKHFKQHDGPYYAKVKADVQANGFTTPALVKFKDPRGTALKKPVLWEGHHRAAVAHELGLHLPVVDYDDAPAAEAAHRSNAEWFSKHPRAEHTATVHTAATADDDERNIHRGFTTVLPPDVHKFVHDPAQPVAARAHMLLAHVRKAKPEINAEEAHGTTGGLGNYWSPIKHKGAEYADQAGWSAYHGHEREHHCGNEYDGSGGCHTTNVVLHAGEPAEKHQWKENFRPGERYDRALSWRLPVRPGAPLHVKGISWREGNDHEPEDYSKSISERDKRGPYTEHDFPTPVKKRAGWSDNPVPSGTRGRDHQGHEVEMTAQNGWAHLDGSYGEDGPTGTETVSDHPVTPYEHVHTWLPDKRYWGPNSKTLDQRLFDGDHLRPEVSHDVMARVGSNLRQYRNWSQWTKVYFAGSEAAQWDDPNGDFDILIGIDWPVFRKDNPKVTGTDATIAQEMTDDLWHHANVDDYYFELDDGRRVGPFSRTFYVNPQALDIRALHPYAAYDVTDDTWAVKPLQVPGDWSASSLPESYWTYAEAMAEAVRAIGALPPEERHRMAANLWEELHTHRSDAFTDGGKGLYDLANVVMKYLEAAPGNPWEKLTEWKNQAPTGSEPWVPTTAKRGFMETIRSWAEVRHDPGSDDSGADHGGVMIALVPPKRVGNALLQEGGEPIESLHVTLAYLGSSKEYSKEQLKALPDLVKGWAHGREELKASVGGVGTFVNPDKHVLWAAVDIPHGTTFRDDLVRHLEGHGYVIRHDHGWTPHMTLKYSNTHVRFLPKIEPMDWPVTELWVCIGGRWESFPIGA